MKIAAPFFSFSLFLLYSFSASAQPKYAVSAIAPALLKNAHVVKRMDETRFEVKSLTEAVYTRKFALTILDEAGQDAADLVVSYDKLRKISSIEGALYDAAGGQLKKVKGKDINDVSATGDNLYDDHRVKQFDFHYRGFPYTVEYEIEEAYNHTFYFPDWEPQDDENISVEKSSYTFVAPAGYGLRYKAFNYKGEPVTGAEKDKKTMRWEATNLAAVVQPFAAPAWRELTPTVAFAPSDFAMEGYKGNSASWTEFGKFMYALFQGRDKLPEAVQQKVTALTAGLSSPKEKIARLYDYLQQNTRYVSIQLGIGGFQPFDATYVAQKGYGDCKALSNYMYSLLKAAGIKSYPALIRSGRGLSAKSLTEDLPSTQFNHVVLFVPLDKDTVWLECTSQDAPAGYSGSFTGNRKALAITEEGGKLVCTPRYGAAENLQVRKLIATVDEEGTLDISSRTSYRAVQQDRIDFLLNNLTKDQVKKMLNEEFELSTYDVNNFSYATLKSSLPEVDENLKINVANYATFSGRRLFLTPNVMNRAGTRHTPSETRTCDYVFDNPYTDIDSVEISIPTGYKLEAQMPETSIKTAYGTYTASVKLQGDKIFYYRKIERFSGRFPAKEGPQIAKFFDDVYKADRARVVLVRTEEAAKPAM